jgi:hypothetical protein
MKDYRYLLFSAALLCVFAAGCGKRVIPDPPLTQNKLVIELFKNLANNEHEMAIDKIIKLRAIETENQYLPQMEEFEVSNIYTDSIQKCLDSGDIDAALKIVDDARKRYGLYRSLIAAEEDLKTLKSIQESMDKILSSDSSEQILLEVEQIKKNTASYTPAKKLLPMLAFQQQLADNMANQENRRAKFSLLADLTTARKEKHSTANILAAQLALENMLPENKNSKIRENLLSGL